MNNCRLSPMEDSLRRVRGRPEDRPVQAAGVLLVLLTGLLSASAQSFSIDWYTVDGGGGGGSAGAYSLTGTIGQPDAGPIMANAPYAVEGGFWSVVGTRPTLRFWIAGDNVVVAWPDTASDCHLQQSINLGDRFTGGVGVWSDVSQVPSVVGGELQVTLPLLGGRQYFFRLVKP
jgi:hypothetical protein